MISLCLYILVFNSLLKDVNAQTSTNPSDPLSSQNQPTNFQPTLAVVIGILSIMFSLTFFLLLYAKFCHRSPTATFINNNRLQIQDGLLRSRSRFSGIDKTVIESLPFFKFSSLKGSKEGLDCAICLSKFEDIEVLRLLPKCKHAFHINCLDQWLEKHSSCPLCRNKISSDDLSTLTYSNSLRFLLNDQSSFRQDDSNIELYVQRQESQRFAKNEDELPIQHENMQEGFDKFNHKIIVSGGSFLKHRWSNLSSADLMFLKSEMILDMSSGRFSSALDFNNNTEKDGILEDGIFDIKEEMERKREFENKFKKIKGKDSVFLPDENMTRRTEDSKGILNEKRSMSEIVVHSRLQENNNLEEERVRRIWLPIARRTVEWFANRETKSTQAGEAEYIRQTLNV